MLLVIPFTLMDSQIQDWIPIDFAWVSCQISTGIQPLNTLEDTLVKVKDEPLCLLEKRLTLFHLFQE